MKTLGAKTRTDNKLDSDVTPGPGIKLGHKNLGGSPLTTAPSLLKEVLFGERFLGRMNGPSSSNVAVALALS